MTKNKGSVKDPSFAFKLITVSLFVFLFLGSGINFQKEDNSIVNYINSSNREDSLFLRPTSGALDFSEIVISQENTVHASSPLYAIGEPQVLGMMFEEPQCRKDIISYTVQRGENISSIATKFNISTQTIVWANEIKNNSLKVGQDIIILPVSGVFHTTKSGDTVSGIAKTYKADEDEIVFCNEIREGKVSTGDILIVPGGEIARPVATSLARAPSPSVSSGSSWLIPPTSGCITQRLHWHNAVDIANNCGTPIYASAAGTIQQTGYHGVAGNYIRIIHLNGVVTFYGHLSRILVSSGQRVSQGSVIGYMGNTGYTIGATGCHIHFEVRGATNPFGAFRLGHRF